MDKSEIEKFVFWWIMHDSY